MSIASGDEAEDGPDREQEMTQSLVQGGESMLVDETDARSPGREMVQVIHAEWSQELREVQRKFADDMTDVKNDLAHVREMFGVLVRRERCAETKAEIAARRLDRMEREKDEADDAEHEANLQEALANQSKAVKVLVDKWFVDKGYGFGKAPTGEIVFIHASTVQGAEVLTIGTDAWVQVVNDDARAQGGYRARRAWGRSAWKAERDKEQANKVAQQVKRAAALTAELAVQSEKKTAAVCDQPPGLNELAGHIEAPNMGAGGSHPQAAMMPDPWATYKCPSTEEGQTTTSAPPEIIGRASTNKGTHVLTKGFREARAKEVQHLQDKQPWDLYRRMPNFRRKEKEDFERDLGHKAMRNGKVDEKSLQEWTDEMQSKVQTADRQRDARERKQMEMEDFNSQQRQISEKLEEIVAFSMSPITLRSP